MRFSPISSRRIASTLRCLPREGGKNVELPCPASWSRLPTTRFLRLTPPKKRWPSWTPTTVRRRALSLMTFVLLYRLPGKGGCLFCGLPFVLWERSPLTNNLSAGLVICHLIVLGQLAALSIHAVLTWISFSPRCIHSAGSGKPVRVVRSIRRHFHHLDYNTARRHDVPSA